GVVSGRSGNVVLGRLVARIDSKESQPRGQRERGPSSYLTRDRLVAIVADSGTEFDAWRGPGQLQPPICPLVCFGIAHRFRLQRLGAEQAADPVPRGGDAAISAATGLLQTAVYGQRTRWRTGHCCRCA